MGTDLKTKKENPFIFAHEHRDEIVWMSQNTNQIPTTPKIVEAVKEALEAKEFNLYPFSKGLLELNNALKIELNAGDYNCLITHGAIEALYIITRALLRDGDEVIATDPSFMPIHHQIRLSNAKPIEIGIYKPPWKMTIQEIQESITKKTKMILLIDPHNPMGSEYTKDEVKTICEVAQEHDLYVVDDITYRDFAFNNTLTHEFLPEKTILVYSFSKNCGMAGMRIGGCLAPPNIMNTIENCNTNVLSVNILAQRAAVKALETKHTWINNVVKTCRDNQEIIKNAVNKIEGCSLPVYPASTNMFLIDISVTGINPDEFQQKLLYEHKVFIRSGNYVSKRYGSNFVRVSFSVPREGCKRFTEALPIVIEDLSKN